jgi:hypothetical protein
MEKIRQILYYKNHFEDFFEKQTEKVKDKIDEVLFLISVIERVPKKFLKHIEGTLHKISSAPWKRTDLFMENTFRSRKV